MKIKVESIDDMTAIVAGLVKQGVQFTVAKTGDGMWTIILTGGF